MDDFLFFANHIEINLRLYIYLVAATFFQYANQFPKNLYLCPLFEFKDKMIWL